MIDPDVREILVKYFTKQLTHTYDEAKQIRLLLKLQNLTIEDIIISSTPQIISQTISPEYIQTQENSIITGLQDAIAYAQGDETAAKQTRQILPIPEQKDLKDYEYVAEYQYLLTDAQLKDFKKDYRSKTDNIVLELNGQLLSTIRRQKLNAWLNRIHRKLDGEIL